jgi:hypothetical protein
MIKPPGPCTPGIQDRRRSQAAEFSGRRPVEEAGIRRADLGDPDLRVSYAAVIALMERAAATLGEPGSAFASAPPRTSATAASWAS